MAKAANKRNRANARGTARQAKAAANVERRERIRRAMARKAAGKVAKVTQDKRQVASRRVILDAASLGRLDEYAREVDACIASKRPDSCQLARRCDEHPLSRQAQTARAARWFAGRSLYADVTGDVTALRADVDAASAMLGTLVTERLSAEKSDRPMSVAAAMVGNASRRGARRRNGRLVESSASDRIAEVYGMPGYDDDGNPDGIHVLEQPDPDDVAPLYYANHSARHCLTVPDRDAGTFKDCNGAIGRGPDGSEHSEPETVHGMAYVGPTRSSACVWFYVERSHLDNERGRGLTFVNPSHVSPTARAIIVDKLRAQADAEQGNGAGSAVERVTFVTTHAPDERHMRTAMKHGTRTIWLSATTMAPVTVPLDPRDHAPSIAIDANEPIPAETLEMVRERFGIYPTTDDGATVDGATCDLAARDADAFQARTFADMEWRKGPAGWGWAPAREWRSVDARTDSRGARRRVEAAFHHSYCTGTGGDSAGTVDDAMETRQRRAWFNGYLAAYRSGQSTRGARQPARVQRPNVWLDAMLSAYV